MRNCQGDCSSSSLDTVVDSASRDELREPKRLQIGAKLAGGRFTVEQRLGQGGMGAVYGVYDQKRDTRVALKVPNQATVADIKGLQSEFAVLSGVRHRNLVSAGQCFEQDELCFFTMEWVQGQDFLEYVRPIRLGLGPIRYGRLCASLAQLATGLGALHRAGTVHCDIKPSNTLVTQSGRVVIIDFGLAMDVKASTRRNDYVTGTLAYMAPEQATGGRVGPPADLYSVGVMLYEALTGELPFGGSLQRFLQHRGQHLPVPPSQRSDAVPRDLETLCMELLAVDPDRRPTADAVLDRLAHTKPRPSMIAPLVAVKPKQARTLKSVAS